jgi:beta-galactosidase
MIMEPQRTQKLFQKLWHGADYNYEQWLEMPDILADDFRLMRLAHCNIMSVGIFSWAMLEPEEGHYDFKWLDELMDRLHENNMYANLATPSAAPPAWLSREYPETRRINEYGIREPHRGRQNFCYTSPIYREKVAAINKQLVEHYKNHPALLMWHISNEYGGVQCHCDLCYNAFHEWLKARYGDLETLNQAWWTTFWSHRYTAWEQIEPVDGSMQGLLLDWKRFTSDRALDFFLAECVPLREITPDIPITTNFMMPDVGLNYWDFAKHLDVICWDSYPRWHQTDDLITAMQTAFYHDLHRSYKQGQPFLLMESTPSVTNWQGISRLKKTGAHTLTSLQAVAHGANSVQYFQWRQSRGGDEKFHGAVMSHLNSPETRTFREVTEVGSILENISSVTQTNIDASVAVIYDLENGWALDYARMPGAPYKNYRETCQQHYNSFWKRGISVDVINSEADLIQYKIVVAPMLYMFPSGLAERIEAFVQAGGTFVTTYISAVVDESDLCFLNGYPPALRRTLGIYSEELDTLAEHQTGKIAPTGGSAFASQESYQFHHYAELVHTETAQVLAAYASDFYTGYPALTVNAHGQGQAYYIAARTRADFLADFYAHLLKLNGVENGLPFAVPAGVSTQVREGNGQRFIFLMNFTDQSQHIDIGEGLINALTGTPAERSLTLASYDLSILSQKRE